MHIWSFYVHRKISVVAVFWPKISRNVAGKFCLQQNLTNPDINRFSRIYFSKNSARKFTLGARVPLGVYRVNQNIVQNAPKHFVFAQKIGKSPEAGDTPFHPQVLPYIQVLAGHASMMQACVDDVVCRWTSACPAGCQTAKMLCSTKVVSAPQYTITSRAPTFTSSLPFHPLRQRLLLVLLQRELLLRNLATGLSLWPGRSHACSSSWSRHRQLIRARTENTSIHVFNEF